MNHTLVDTSVWIDFFRSGNSKLDHLLEEGNIILHPFIFGELVCGNFKNRETVLSLLENLPCCKPAQHNEVVHFIESNQFFGRGAGWIDFHLLVAAKLNNLEIFSLDKKLQSLSREIGVS